MGDLDLELGADQPFFDLYDEDLVEGLDGQAMQLFAFRLSFLGQSSCLIVG